MARGEGRTNEQCAQAAACIPNGPGWNEFRMHFNIYAKQGVPWDDAIKEAAAHARETDPGFVPDGIDRARLEMI